MRKVILAVAMTAVSSGVFGEQSQEKPYMDYDLGSAKTANLLRLSDTQSQELAELDKSMKPEDMHQKVKTILSNDQMKLAMNIVERERRLDRIQKR